MEIANATVLLIDNDKHYRGFMKELLSKMGLKIVESKDPKVAFEYLINNKSPDLIILDMILPMMDGFQVLRHIRSNHKTKYTPVIPYTTLKQEHLILRLFQLRISGFIDKRASPKEIALKVKNALEREFAKREKNKS